MSLLPRAAAPFRDLIDESFDEASFLWGRWEGELASPARNLDEIATWTEDRLHGALDGVRVGGAMAIGPATKALRSDEAERVMVGTAVLASSTEPRASDVLTRALRTADARKLNAIVRSLELFGSDDALRTAGSALATSDPHHASALCRLKAFRRVQPGDELTTAFASGVPEIQAQAMRAARLVAGTSTEALIASALESPESAVRYAAAESGLCLRMPQAWDLAARLAGQPDSSAAPYLGLLAMFGKDVEHETVYGALRVPALQPAAIRAVGHIGTSRAVEACLAGMAHAPVARACGEAYCWITGADLVRDRLTADDTPADAPAFDEDDLDMNLVPAPEALWPLPDPEAVRRHWAARLPAWSPGVRHIQGRPVTGETLLSAIETGPMLRRPDLAFELCVKTQGRYDVETRAFADRQRQMMAAGRTAILSQGR